MRLTVLGCRAGMPADGQASSGYLLSAGASRLLLDCGPGVAAALTAVIHPSELSGVVISHFHLDHCYDILPIGKILLAKHLRYDGDALGDTAAIPAIPLYVPEGGRAVLDRLAALFPVGSMPTMDRAFELAFDVREYRPGDTFQLGGSQVTMFGLRHAVPNCGTRVESAAGTFAYTGDTGVTDRLHDLARDVDLMLAEATLTQTDQGTHGHLSAGDAGRAATAAGARQLALTHFTSTAPEWLHAREAEAREVFDAPLHLATPGVELTVAPGDHAEH